MKKLMLSLALLLSAGYVVAVDRPLLSIDLPSIAYEQVTTTPAPRMFNPAPLPDPVPFPN